MIYRMNKLQEYLAHIRTDVKSTYWTYTIVVFNYLVDTDIQTDSRLI